MNIYYCTEDKIILAGLRVKEGAAIDFTQPDSFADWQQEQLSMINAIKSERTYTREREQEVFELLQNGCLITDDRLFNSIMLSTT